MLAYWDTITAGMVPCKVLKTMRENHGFLRATIQLTASRGVYKRGEITTTSALFVIPREHAHRRKYGWTITGSLKG